MAKNKKEMTIEETATELVITIPKQKPFKESKSGKSLVVATTHGNIPTSTIIDGKPLTIGVNAYIKAD